MNAISIRSNLLSSISKIAIISIYGQISDQNMQSLVASIAFYPMRSILDEIRHALDAGLYYPAFSVALTIPDICVALTMPRTSAVIGKDYIAFVDRYSAPSELGASGEQCYQLRCGVVHRGNAAGHKKFDADHLLITTPQTQMRMHGLTLQATGQRAHVLDLKEFCNAMIDAAHRWYADHYMDKEVVENLPKLLRLAPGGLPPFIEGSPVIVSSI